VANNACFCSQAMCSTSNGEADVFVVADYRWQGSTVARSGSKPNMRELKVDFDSCAGEDSRLGVSELAAAWRRSVERKVGKLRSADVQLIERSSELLHGYMDLDRNGRICFEEFATFMLGGLEERGALPGMHAKLQAFAEQEPEKFRDLIAQFCTWDQDGDGYLSAKDYICGLPSQEADAALLELVRDADLNGDGRLDLWETIAHSMGRRRIPVEMLVYDVSDGMSTRLTPFMLGGSVEAIYHTSVLVYGSEWWYGGRLFRSIPPCSSCFGPPLRSSVMNLRPSEYYPNLLVVPLGYTLATLEEFQAFLSQRLRGKYTRENYDVILRNCNSFTDEAVRFLTGTGVPEQVLRLQEFCKASHLIRLLRPVLNRWLGGFRTDVEEGDLSPCSSRPCNALRMATEKQQFDESPLGTGDLVATRRRCGGSVLVATVTDERTDCVDLKCFDPSRSEFVRHRVNKSGSETVIYPTLLEKHNPHRTL
jgi:Ca2+-binding EF-hand superfamily protein